MRGFLSFMAEPFVWIFFCFFQPIRFRNKFEKRDFPSMQFVVPAIRLAIPIFLLTYPVAIIGRLILVGHGSLPFLVTLTRTTTFDIVAGIVGGLALSLSGNLRLGIVGGLALGIASGFANHFTFAVATGLLLGVSEYADVSVVVFIAAGIALGGERNIMYGLCGGIALGIVGILVLKSPASKRNFLYYAVNVITGGIIGFFLLFAADGFLRFFTLNAGADFVNVTKNVIADFVKKNTNENIISISSVLFFTISYIAGFYRLPLYPISGLSGCFAYIASRRNPAQVFFYLHGSSLYWDEYIYLPLPKLKQTLLIAAGLNFEQALEEFTFIAVERPQQKFAVQDALLELVIADLEVHNSIYDVATASQQLSKILSQDAELTNPQWLAPFVNLNDVSYEAARYCSPIAWQSRKKALEDLIVNLRKAHTNTHFSTLEYNKRLQDVIKKWKKLAQQELSTLEHAPEESGRIENPYNPGTALKLRDNLFVGRRDLARQLEETLRRPDRRPTFLLKGERRIGKSSTLRQLPNLLGANYLPIFYDLQSPGMSSNIAAFFNIIAEEICEGADVRGIKLSKMEYKDLIGALQENEAAVYRLFDEWLDDLENRLTQDGRILLLTFDEFEHLEDIGQNKNINLKLLLSWFRSCAQNRTHVALLFCGLRTFSELGVSWASYFVNVQTLKVSFLQPAEARWLIARPVSSFAGEQVFGEKVIDAIMQTTGGHPFLIQALCSSLIEHLNAENRNRAETQDVAIALKRVFENWGNSYFLDLWERTGQEQRLCLNTLNILGKGSLAEIEEQSGLDKKIIRRKLDNLIDRDLVLLDKGDYRISTPIFSEWIERNSYN